MEHALRMCQKIFDETNDLAGGTYCCQASYTPDSDPAGFMAMLINSKTTVAQEEAVLEWGMVFGAELFDTVRELAAEGDDGSESTVGNGANFLAGYLAALVAFSAILMA